MFDLSLISLLLCILKMVFFERSGGVRSKARTKPDSGRTALSCSAVPCCLPNCQKSRYLDDGPYLSLCMFVRCVAGWQAPKASDELVADLPFVSWGEVAHASSEFDPSLNITWKFGTYSGSYAKEGAEDTFSYNCRRYSRTVLLPYAKFRLPEIRSNGVTIQ